MTDRTQRMAVAALGLITTIVVIGVVLLAAIGEDVPESLVAIGSASGGALAGIITNRAAPTFTQQAPMQPTVVERPPVVAQPPLVPRADPAPTEPTDTADYRYQPPPWEQPSA